MSQSRIKIRKKKSSRVRNWGPARWMAVGTLAAYSTVSGDLATRAQAQDRTAPASRTSVNQTSNLPVCRFDIDPGPLSAVLPAFQREAELRVIVPKDSILAISSPGVVGQYTPQEALRKILAGTGISYQFT